MAQSRLSLVLVILLITSRFLDTSQDDSESRSEDTDSLEQNLPSLLCITFVEPGNKKVNLVVDDSAGTWVHFTVDLGDCATNYTDVLKIQAMNSKSNGDAMNISLKTSFGDCDMTCLKSRNIPYATLYNVTRYNKKKEVKCVKATLLPFTDRSDGSCTNTKKLKRTKQPTTTSTPELSLSPTESSVAPEDDHTNSTLPPGQTTTLAANATALHDQATAAPAPATTSTVLLTALVLELVATCVMAVFVVWVVHSGGRNRGVTPATTNVRRNSHQGEVYICENDLYEPFTGPPAAQAAQATGGQA